MNVPDILNIKLQREAQMKQKKDNTRKQGENLGLRSFFKYFYF